MSDAVKRLQAELEETLADLKAVEAQLEERPEFGLGTGSTGAFTWEMALARKEQLEEKIETLRELIARAEAGTYGICETCGKPIDPERLEAVPTATQCIDCARKHVRVA
ncbi:MAG: TraR/DksA family transcriptional regulator [Caldilineae bacterium]|nr:MAG: TraR/DksA family transcriptional regulator [Caldilineae bacterium]